MGVGGGETCVWGLSDRLGWVSRPLTPLSLTPWFFRSYRHHRFPRLIEIPPRGAEKPLSADSFLLSLHCEDSGLYTRPVQRNFLGPVNINLETQTEQQLPWAKCWCWPKALPSDPLPRIRTAVKTNSCTLCVPSHTRFLP